MSNSVDPDETAHHMSRLIWIYAVCKSLLLTLVEVKELILIKKLYNYEKIIKITVFKINSKSARYE